MVANVIQEPGKSHLVVNFCELEIPNKVHDNHAHARSLSNDRERVQNNQNQQS